MVYITTVDMYRCTVLVKNIPGYVGLKIHIVLI